MQRFPCPFCGLRDEREFHLAGEAGKTRPDTTGEIIDTDWATYLHMHRNEKGRTREVWMHTTCAELFIMERDSVTMDVLGTETLRVDR
jgi:heterotetrameric sarcosine oxidase delta subunit